MDSSEEEDTEEDQDQELYDPIGNLENEQILIRVSPGNVAVLDVPDRLTTLLLLLSVFIFPGLVCDVWYWIRRLKESR